MAPGAHVAHGASGRSKGESAAPQRLRAFGFNKPRPRFAEVVDSKLQSLLVERIS